MRIELELVRQNSLPENLSHFAKVSYSQTGLDNLYGKLSQSPESLLYEIILENI